MVGGLLHSKPITLRASLPAALPPARADMAKVRQILLNLLSNAVKFTEQGTITVSASYATLADELDHALALGVPAGEHGQNGYSPTDGAGDQRTTQFLAVSVRDTGIGIAPEHLPLIFEEFRQVHSRRSEKQGSGLGLSICRKLIEAHGGRIWVESVVGQGSTFTFTLPCAAEAGSVFQTAEDRVEALEQLNV